MPEQSKIDQRLRRLQDRMLNPEPPIPMAKPGERVSSLPSAGQYVLGGLKRRSGDILSLLGGTLMPGSGALGLASRLLGAEAGQEAGDVLAGQPVTPGKGAAAQGLGEAAGSAGSYLLSPLRIRGYANRIAKQAVGWLQKEVDAWGGYPETAKGLYEMAHGTGQRLLSRDFEKSLRSIKSQLSDDLTVHVQKRVETLIPGSGSTGAQMRLELQTEPRNAKALIDDLPKLRKAGGPEYREALQALERDLPTGVSPDLDEARRQYKVGAGFIDFASGPQGSRFLMGEQLDPIRLQRAIDLRGKRLVSRGMDDLLGILRGPGRKPPTAVPLGTFRRGAIGAAGGELMAEAAGAPRGVGILPGVVAGELYLPQSFYRHVPMTAAERYATRLGGQVIVGEPAREMARRAGY